LFGALLAFSNGCGEADVKRYPVSGTVFIDGKAAERVLVQLTRIGASSGLNNDAYPSGLTDATGSFVVGKEQGALGAVEGDYVVTFTWISGPELEAFDKLKGVHSSVANSKIRLKVPSEGLEQLEYKLTMSAAK
jgi:hypothetical protein